MRWLWMSRSAVFLFLIYAHNTICLLYAFTICDGVDGENMDRHSNSSSSNDGTDDDDIDSIILLEMLTRCIFMWINVKHSLCLLSQSLHRHLELNSNVSQLASYYTFFSLSIQCFFVNFICAHLAQTLITQSIFSCVHSHQQYANDSIV